MAQFTITIPDAVAPRVQEAYLAIFGYQEQIPDPQNLGSVIANPETPANFVRRILREQMRDVLRSYEGNKAQTAANESVATDFG